MSFFIRKSAFYFYYPPFFHFYSQASFFSSAHKKNPVIFLKPISFIFMLKEDYLKLYLPISPDSYLFSAHSSINEKTIRKLKRGHMLIEDSIDLHGFTQNETEEALEEFITQSLEQGFRCILIIHGKGSQAILKNYVNAYLNNHSHILAFCSAKPKNGGLGAVYVLLKKQKDIGSHYDEEE